jgi:hypothetical protein
MFSLLLISIAELLLWPADIRLFAAFFIVGEYARHPTSRNLKRKQNLESINGTDVGIWLGEQGDKLLESDPVICFRK